MYNPFAQHKLPRLTSAANAGIYALAILSPWFFLPISTDVIEFSKRLLFLAVAILMVGLWSIDVIQRKALRITITPFSVPALVFFGAVLASSFLATSYSKEALITVGLLYGCFTTILLFGSGLIRLNPVRLFTALNIGGFLLTVTTVLQMIGMGPSALVNRLFQLSTPTTPGFNMGGSVLSAGLFLLALCLGNVVWFLRAKHSNEKTVTGIWFGLTLAGFLLHAYLLLPGKPGNPLLTPAQASWMVAVDMLKQPRTAAFGAGPASYTAAFSQFRPSYLNLTPEWSIRYAIGRTEVLHIITTLGLLGLAGWIGLAVATLRTTMHTHTTALPLGVMLTTLVASQLLLPSSTMLVMIFCVLAAGLAAIVRQDQPQRVKDMLFGLFTAPTSRDIPTVPAKEGAGKFFVIGVVVVLAGGTAWTLAQVGRLIQTEFSLVRSVQAANRQDANGMYEAQRQLVNSDPYSDIALRTFSATNFGLAQSIAENKQASEQDRQNLPLLIQQAVAAAKTATEVDPRKVENWENLAGIYEQLIGVVDSADQFAIAAYIRAVQVDPTNPALRMAIGRIYANAGNLEQAARLYEQAVELKPNWPNAFYSVAVVYEKQGNLAGALQAYSTALQLLPNDNPDRSKLESKVQTLTDQVKKAEEDAKKGTTSQQPTKTSNAAKTEDTQGQIKIPEDLGLPQETPPVSVPEGPTPTSPTPTPLAAPTFPPSGTPAP